MASGRDNRYVHKKIRANKVPRVTIPFFCRESGILPVFRYFG
jgi:hypothetical protein